MVAQLLHACLLSGVKIRFHDVDLTKSGRDAAFDIQVMMRSAGAMKARLLVGAVLSTSLVWLVSTSPNSSETALSNHVG